MKIRSFVTSLALVLGMGAMATRANASTITFNLPDIGTFAGYTEANVGQTYSGDGFLGLYNSIAVGSEQFAHLFTVEQGDYGRTVSQTDVSALAGSTITSATVRFDLLDGSGSDAVTVTGFAGTGALGYVWDAPLTNYGQAVGLGASGSNAIDVTSLLAGSILNGDSFFNMHFQGSSNLFNWTYTYADFGYGADRANVRLDVEYTQDLAAVPEPATMSLLGVGFATLAAGRWLKKRKRA